MLTATAGGLQGSLSAYDALSGLQVLQGGTLTVESGGSVSSSTVSSGGVLVVDSGGTAFGATVYGVDEAYGGAKQTGVLISSGGTLELADDIVSSGATLNLLRVSSIVAYPQATLESGATVASYDAQIQSAGTQTVQSGATATATTVSRGGTLVLSAGGAALGGMVLSGGVLSGAGSLSGSVQDAGLVSGVTVASGGTLLVQPGGVATGIVLPSGAILIDDGSVTYTGSASVKLAGTLSGSGTLVDDTTGSLLLSGQDQGFSGTVVISGGTVELGTAGALQHGVVDFAPASGSEAVLDVLSAATPASGAAPTLENFASTSDRMSLLGLVYFAGATATVSGSTLTVVDGATTLRFALTGTVGSSFRVTSGSGGYVEVTPLAAQGNALVEAAAGFAPAGALTALPAALRQSPAALEASEFAESPGRRFALGGA